MPESMQRRRSKPIQGFLIAVAPFAAAAFLAIPGRCADGTTPPPAASLIAGTTPASPVVFFGGAPLSASSPERAPFRDEKGILCVAPESLSPLGISYIDDEKAGMVTLAGPGGGSVVTVRERYRGAEKAGGAFVPAVEVIEALGGKCEWSAINNVLYARAVLVSAQMFGGQLRLHATLPILPNVRIDRASRLVVVDVPGAEIGALSKTLNLSDPAISRSRAGQFQDDIARLALYLKQPGALSVLGNKPSTDIILNPADPDKAVSLPADVSTVAAAVAKASAAVAAAPAAVAPSIAISIVGLPAATAPLRPNTASVKAAAARAAKPVLSRLSGVTFNRISDDHAQFIVSADRAPSVRAGLTHGRLTLDLLNSSLAADKAGLIDKCVHPFLRTAQLVASSDTAARLVLDLTRAVSYTLRPLGGGQLQLDLNLPQSATGKLAGKLIVVDPGHGAHDSGAVGHGHREKDVTLAIGTQLAQILRDAGANVILTRSNDSFIPVDDRPQVGNRMGADFFISVHADSGDSNHSVSGSTVYFHSDWASCRTLAQCIADRLSDAGGISSRGVHSDTMKFGGRFVSGYGVLRLSQMVAVLVECGYISNNSDASHLTDPDHQKRIAKAIANGLRDYIEGNPNFDTRFVNPQPASAVGGAIPGPGDSSLPGNAQSGSVSTFIPAAPGTDAAAAAGDADGDSEDTAPAGSDAVH